MTTNSVKIPAFYPQYSCTRACSDSDGPKDALLTCQAVRCGHPNRTQISRLGHIPSHPLDTLQMPHRSKRSQEGQTGVAESLGLSCPGSVCLHSSCLLPLPVGDHHPSGFCVSAQRQPPTHTALPLWLTSSISAWHARPTPALQHRASLP